MTQNQQIPERDYYAEKTVTASHSLKFMLIHIGIHMAVYYCVLFCGVFFSAFAGSATYVVLQAVTTIPLAIILPLILLKRYCQSVIPKLYTLADAPENWHRKAIRLILPGEIVRFLLGFVPIPILQYGVITSPAAYCLYNLCYITPLGKYEAVLVNRNGSAVDTIVFLGIYILYFAVYEVVIFRKFRKETVRHTTFLTGSLHERNRTQKYI